MVNKMPTRKILILACTIVVFGVCMLLSTGMANAAAPALTSATYNVGTGALVLTGTNFVDLEGTADNDIDPKKFVISDSFSHEYTLTVAKKVEITGATAATITVSDKDKAALALWMDKDGTASVASKNYNIAALAGWNGPTATGDLTGNAVTVSGVATLTSATYDITTKKLVLTGTNLVNSAKGFDIFPKFITISNSFDERYTLTTSTVSVEITDATAATLTLSTKDAAGVEAIFDKNGTKNVADQSYNIAAAAGWNGPTSMGDLAGNAITVSNYAAPVATSSTASAVTLGAGSVAGKSTKVGTLYLIPKATDLTGATTTSLDTLVTGKTALKAKIVAAATDVKISVIKDLNIGGDTATYVLVAVDIAGTLSAKSADITLNNVAAPALVATAAAGSAAGTTKVTVTAGQGNTLAYKVSSTTIAIPKVSETPAGVTDNYVSGADISGVSTTNKFLGVYELASGKVVKFKLITLTATMIKADTTAPTYSGATINIAKKVVTLNFSKDVVNALADAAALKAAVTFAADGSTFGALGGSDTVAITSGDLVITFNSALTTATNKIKIAANALKDAAGNKIAAEVTTAAIDATDKSDAAVAVVVSPIANGATCELNITGAKDALGANLAGSIAVTVTSDQAEAQVFSGNVNFVGGAATVTTSALTTAATHTLTITIAGVTGANINQPTVVVNAP